jgi:hypothetical protein
VVVDERDEPDDMLERGAEDTPRPLWKRRSLPVERGEKGVQQPNIAQTELASNTAQDPTPGSTPEPTPQPTSDPTLDLTPSPTHEQQGLRRSARSTKGNTTLFPPSQWALFCTMLAKVDLTPFEPRTYKEAL